MFKPGGFPRPRGARKRVWKTKTGKANFTAPHSLADGPANRPGVYQLVTLRADGQFNTTIYNESDRFRGVHGSRWIVMMNPDDMSDLTLVTLETDANDRVQRRLADLQVVPHDIPQQCLAGYFPECNVLVPLWHYAEGSKVPAAKSVPVRIRKQDRARTALRAAD